MKIYHVSQNVNNGYDTYSNFVVICENEDEARYTNPGGFHKWHDNSWWFQYSDGTEGKQEDDTWCLPSQVEVIYFGESKKNMKGIICSSFHAG